MSSTVMFNKSSPVLRLDEGETPQPMDVKQEPNGGTQGAVVDIPLQEAGPQLKLLSVQDSGSEILTQGIAAKGPERQPEIKWEETSERQPLPYKQLSLVNDEHSSRQHEVQDVEHHRHNHEQQGTQEPQTNPQSKPSPSSLSEDETGDSIQRIAECDQELVSTHHSEHEPERKRLRMQAADACRKENDQNWAGTAEDIGTYQTEARRSRDGNGEGSQKYDGKGTYQSPEKATKEAMDETDETSDEAWKEAREEVREEGTQEETQKAPEGTREQSLEKMPHDVVVDVQHDTFEDTHENDPSFEAGGEGEAGCAPRHDMATLQEGLDEPQEPTESISQPSTTDQGLQAESEQAVVDENSHPSSWQSQPEHSNEGSSRSASSTKDSALSTLASAAVAIKNLQGPISTLSAPPVSPTTKSAESSGSGSGSTSSSTPPSTSAATTSFLRGAGRPPLKMHAPRDAGGYLCELCPGERFGRVHDLKRHQISKHNEMTWPCDFCHRPFVRRDALLRHYSVKAARRDGVHPTEQEENRLKEAKARAKLLA
ncbi:hypothetical protein BGZ65_010639 [Modicella reniformis]|uniref:C2H2-type domain-containing protein n=1 Tax=Modicella reniformis TaxID=1440133 RepID=A0A9P6LSU5_9FUNG|nr:hypothetical protein BGZ65_010639 [Modicella reniformis]